MLRLGRRAPRTCAAGRLLLVAAALVVAGVLLGAPQAVAAEGERITAYDVTLEIQPDGTLAVTEDIDYDFGSNERHGIFRDIPTRVPYDDEHERVYRISDVRVSSRTNAPADVETSEDSGVTRLRIGDPDRTVTGAQTYTIAYRVEGALNDFPDHQELYWNAIGDAWDVPIESPTVSVQVPSRATIEQSACFAGPAGSTLPCEAVDPSPTRVDFGQPSGLAPHSAFTVVAGLPAGSVTGTGPILEETWSVGRSLTPTPATGALAGGLVLLGAGGMAALVARRGRDRRYAGQTPGVLPASGQPVREEVVPVIGAGAVAVQFQPPPGLRPGQLGTLLDEQASVLDVTATIVDLAVRGHLRIEELPKSGWFSSRDWRLVQLSGGQGELLPYERELYDGLFAGRTEVLLSDLKKTFSSRLKKVQDKLYDDVTAAGWFRGRPDKVRGRWTALGVALVVAAVWVGYQLAQRTHWGLVSLALVVVALTVLALARKMPARTASGTAVLAQARGFREYIRTAEAEQLRFEEQQDVFSRYLPYAVVFGETERWVKVFGVLAAAGATGAAAAWAPAWYVGPTGWSPENFSDSLGSFTAVSSGAMAAATPSSSGGSGFSGGFSGGGGGGGGGGSW